MYARRRSVAQPFSAAMGMLQFVLMQLPSRRRPRPGATPPRRVMPFADGGSGIYICAAVQMGKRIRDFNSLVMVRDDGAAAGEMLYAGLTDRRSHRVGRRETTR